MRRLDPITRLGEFVGAVLDGFGYVTRFQGLTPVQVSNGACDLENLGMGPCAEAQP